MTKEAKEVKEWKYTIIAVCMECGEQEFKGQKRYMTKIEEIEKKGRMSNYARVFGEFRFVCNKCGRMIKVITEEIKEKWEK